MIERVTYWRIPRDEDRSNRPTRYYDREFERALRWSPSWLVEETEHDEEHEWYAKGERALRSLRAGQDISERNLTAAFDYLHAAVLYYEDLLPEPYTGRNGEAIADLQSLHVQLTTAMALA